MLTIRQIFEQVLESYCLRIRIRRIAQSAPRSRVGLVHLEQGFTPANGLHEAILAIGRNEFAPFAENHSGGGVLCASKRSHDKRKAQIMPRNSR
jgi:hypothetical protein